VRESFLGRKEFYTKNCGESIAGLTSFCMPFTQTKVESLEFECGESRNVSSGDSSALVPAALANQSLISIARSPSPPRPCVVGFESWKGVPLDGWESARGEG